ncbi:hypothetical protein [Paenibacillus jiagnxiensis]|uniref:hypothetical protein n=1 Tax=Paenibacillus jiagnxiensis TaxID=3228926 RepID=UPI0033B04C24
MDNLIVEPNIGIGNIKLGMRPKEYEEEIQKYTVQYNKQHDPEYFHYIFKVEYNTDDKINFIEVASHVDEEFNFLYRGVTVFRTKAIELVATIDKDFPYDGTDWELGYTYYFPQLGLSLWRSGIFTEEMKDEDWFKEMSKENQDDEMKFEYFQTVSLRL